MLSRVQIYYEQELKNSTRRVSAPLPEKTAPAKLAAR
jgi:hypothetical protein